MDKLIRVGDRVVSTYRDGRYIPKPGDYFMARATEPGGIDWVDVPLRCVKTDSQHMVASSVYSDKERHVYTHSRYAYTQVDEAIVQALLGDDGSSHVD